MLRRLCIARDADAAGEMALTALIERAEAAALSSRIGDFNEDLRTLGLDELRAALRLQLAPQDVVRFMLWAAAGTGGQARSRVEISTSTILTASYF